ncbi:flavin reductase family protein [Gillisia sp. M10.2A]|uniref:Flavin reductase family protein n=1 Tax=Gillisia lutea TaxID=2909668 RepID=A0ABS9EHU8_9FLAO|nr:flavin reductase [Gillisia lutea]MCF4102416.1 flavin reductase family protein [Gillisia lutea]
MKHYTLHDLDALDRIFRNNLINSATGYKSANLLATQSRNGNTNLAVFNSVTHLGSNPPLLSFILRPTTVARNTYKNISETNYFSINHINSNIIAQAHQTSAKYDSEISEFTKTGLTEEYLDDFFAPYLKESFIKLGCRYINEYLIKENNTIMIIAEIQHLYFMEDIEMTDGWLQLDKAQTVAINGLDGYALPSLLDRFGYARPEKDISSLLKTQDLIKY